MTGYFYLERGLFEHPLFNSNHPFSSREAWVWLIEHANFEPSKFRFKSEIHDIPRGDYAGSFRNLARKWHWSVDRVIRETRLWQKDDMVIIDTRRGYVQITLCNYTAYQDKANTDATETRHKRDGDATPTSTQTSTNQRNKGIKESIITPTPLPDWMPIDAWEGYLEMRKRKRAVATEYAKQLIIKQLEVWRSKGHDPTAILQKSIKSNWTDIFEPKGEQNAKHTGFAKQDYYAGTEGFDVT